MASAPFHFRKFSVSQQGAVHPVGTDGVLLGAWADVRGCARVLDVGTGTGIISLMIAQRTQDACITGIDIHVPSLNCAKENFAASPWANRLNTQETSLQDLATAKDGEFDLIVSNPPFFSEQTRSPDPERSLGRHNATLSPVELVTAVSALLAPGGRFCVILPVREGRLLCEQAVLNRLYYNIEMTVHTGPGKQAERLMLQFSRDPGWYHKSSLLLRDESGGKTPEFGQLTGEFYTV